MSYPVMPLGFLGSQGDNDQYQISRSLRFNSADSANLTRTPPSAGNRKTFTISFWAKRSSLSSNFHFIQAGPDTNTITSFSIGENGSSPDNVNLTFFDYQSGSYTTRLISSLVLRDPSAWMNFVLSVDTTQVTASNRVKIFLNGNQVTSFSTSTYPNQNQDLVCNNNVAHRIGSYVTTRYSDGYMTEYHFIDGQALTPSDFGETDATTGRWKAKAYSGTYGTNGFYLNFSDNSGTTSTTLGKDSSGNSNNWTPNNFSVTAGAGNDSLVDSPTNYGIDTGLGGEVRGNYATWNAVDSTASSRSNGNLDFSTPSSGWGTTRATIGINSGKWYWEVTYVSGTDGFVGIMNQIDPITNYVGQSSTSYSYYTNGNKYNNTSPTAYGASYTNNDVIGVALDLDAGTIVFYKNGASQGTAYSSIPLTNTYLPAAGDGTGGGGASFIGNFGQRPFAYAAPSGFKALCTTNLPTPVIKKPSSAMDVITYTGNGSARSLTGLGFSPDLIWIKGRSGATDHALYDTTRGVQQDLGSNLTTDETTQAQGVTAFNSDGFSIGTLAKLNTNSATYVGWAWDESAISGLDIVAYTGNGTARTIAHNLGVAPKMIIVKARTTASTDQGWPVYHASNTAAPETDYLLLNSTAATADLDTVWNDTAPTASVFSVGTGALTNTNNDTYIAYCFAEVEGYSKFGSYTGNGNADGPFVWCGFRPRWVMVKNASASATVWCIWDTARDTFNLATTGLQAQASTGDSSGFDCDINSNGFKIRDTETSLNGSGNTIVFAAFAEFPFKYSRAR